jgi:hypothetical protein
LPEPPKLDVRKALIAEPEPAAANDPDDPEIITTESASDYCQGNSEKQVNEMVLRFGVFLGD